MTSSSTSANSNAIVGIGEIRIVQASNGHITTHALGSCIGVTIFDPVAGLGGMLHYLLPSPINGEQVPSNKIATYATSGLPELFREAYSLGGAKDRLIVCAAGAANLLEDTAEFQIGKRNRTMMRKLFWKNNIALASEDTGGNEARTMKLSLADGTVIISNKGKERVLWRP